MCIFVSRPMKIVTFLRKNADLAKRVVDFPRERDTFRNKIMEIVEDFDEKSYNNNGKPWKSSKILRLKPKFFIVHHFSSFFRFFSKISFSSFFFYFFHFSFSVIIFDVLSFSFILFHFLSCSFFLFFCFFFFFVFCFSFILLYFLSFSFFFFFCFFF